MYTPKNPCKHCGSTEFYLKEKYKGYCEFRVDIDENKECENEDMYITAEHRLVSKFYWCANCHKRGELVVTV